MRLGSSLPFAIILCALCAMMSHFAMAAVAGQPARIMIPVSADGRARSPFVEVSSTPDPTSVGGILGDPLPAQPSLARVESCMLVYAKNDGMPGLGTYYMTIRNRTPILLNYVQVGVKSRFVSYRFAYLFNLKPQEVRRVLWPDRTLAFAPARVSSFECTAGVAARADGTVIDSK